MMVGPFSRGPMDATSVPSRAILARRFFETFTVAPAARICLRRVWSWATVRPEYWATTTTLEALKASFNDSMAAFFSARSTWDSLGWRLLGPPGCTSHPDNLGARTAFVRTTTKACPPDASDQTALKRQVQRFEPIVPALRPERSVFTRLCRPVD